MLSFSFLSFYSFAQTPENSGQTDMPAKASMVTGNYLIKPGDLLDIRVFNRPQFSRDGVRVDDIGTVKMPFLKDEVQAACRTARELADDLALQFGEMLRNPQVDVLVKEYQTKSIAFLGAVKSPSRLELQKQQSVRLLDMLAVVGGPATNAGNSIQVIHNNDGQACQKKNSTQEKVVVVEEVKEDNFNTSFYSLKDALAGEINPLLEGGDIVILQEADQAYVIGNVLKPSALLLQDPITITQALAMVGGTLSDTKKDKVKLIRQIPGSTKKREIIIDLKAIADQKAEDLVLEPNDILSVPVSGKKRFLKTILGTIVPSIARLPVQVIR